MSRRRARIAVNITFLTCWFVFCWALDDLCQYLAGEWIGLAISFLLAVFVLSRPVARLWGKIDRSIF